MKYRMKAGVLSEESGGQPLVRIRGIFYGPEKRIFSSDGALLLRTDICRLDGPLERAGEIQYREYVMYYGDGTQCAVAKPAYAENAGRPLCHMPRVDHAVLQMNDAAYFLMMQNDQNYVLFDACSQTVMQVVHRGIAGGWDINVYEVFLPEILCGLFVFCRYMEQENEFLVV